VKEKRVWTAVALEERRGPVVGGRREKGWKERKGRGEGGEEKKKRRGENLVGGG
jgi:hypothetical protein